MLDTSIAVTPLTDSEENRVHTPDQLWTDDFALKVAVQDFNLAEAYRTANCDARYRNADELYLGWVAQKYWEGTKMPRASVSVLVAFEQVEAFLPKILGAIFGDNPWFQADALGSCTPEQARQWRDKLIDQMGVARVRECYRRVFKSRFIYGDGIAKVSWSLRTVKRARWDVAMEPRYRTVIDPIAGPQEHFETFDRVLNKRDEEIIENRPCLEWISVKDYYADPNARGPLTADGRYHFIRRLVSVDDLDALRDQREFKIPSKGQLLEWARNRPSAAADATRSLGSWSPQIDQTVDPGGLHIEVIERLSKDRVVWVANREQAILNCPNPYSCVPLFKTFYADVLDRPYSMGICDVTESEQRVQSSIINARLDELSLSIHRPVKKRRGLQTPQYMLRVRPGQVIEMDDTDKDYRMMETENITQGAYIEVDASQMRAQKITGMTDLAVMGVPSAGGNSASRTATGVGAQVNASASRIQYCVENDEDNFIEPMLNFMVELNAMFPPIGSKDAEAIALSRVKVTMRASAKMQSRMALMQVFPLVSQSMMNPAFMAQLAKQGKALDFEELFNMLLDFTGYRKRAALIRDLTPEEKQQMGQPPAEEMIRMKMQQERIAGTKELTELKLRAKSEDDAAGYEREGEMHEEGLLAKVGVAAMGALSKPEPSQNGKK